MPNSKTEMSEAEEIKEFQERFFGEGFRSGVQEASDALGIELLCGRSIDKAMERIREREKRGY